MDNFKLISFSWRLIDKEETNEKICLIIDK